MKFFALASAFAATAFGCDLYPEKSRLDGSWVIDTISADNDPCLQAENCLSGPGLRTILRFDSVLRNIGTTDCKVGWTPQCPAGNTIPADQYPFHYDQCHRHWHLVGFSDYALKDAQGNMVASGYKNGLCLMDIECSRGQRYTCQNQGLSVGCADIYDKTLSCQWIDITDIDQTQTYTFEWRTNIDRNLPEENYLNNIVTTTVNLATTPRYRVREGPSPNQCPINGGRPQTMFGSSTNIISSRPTTTVTRGSSSTSSTRTSSSTPSYSSYSSPSYRSSPSRTSYSSYGSYSTPSYSYGGYSSSPRYSYSSNSYYGY